MTKTEKKITSKKLLALSWKIATEPRLYWELAPNPYKDHVFQVVSKRFADLSKEDIVRAVVLAEPEGRYDRNFMHLTEVNKEKELRKQKRVTLKINKKLTQYLSNNARDLSRLHKHSVYERLSKVVFGSDDEKEIELKYSQQQRLDFKLLIVSFVEDSQNPDLVQKHEKLSSKQLLVKRVLAAFSLMLIFYFAELRYQNISKQEELKNKILGAQSQMGNRIQPKRLSIPKIKVDAIVQTVGVDPNGEMGVPDSTNDVGWFGQGSSPGQVGSAVIAGHVDDENGGDAVFTNLDKLEAGDKIYVEDDKGVTTTFVVRESRTYSPGYVEEVFSSSEGVHLNLVTCDGVWDFNKKSFTKRLVVFADIE